MPTLQKRYVSMANSRRGGSKPLAAKVMLTADELVSAVHQASSGISFQRLMLKNFNLQGKFRVFVSVSNRRHRNQILKEFKSKGIACYVRFVPNAQPVQPKGKKRTSRITSVLRDDTRHRGSSFGVERLKVMKVMSSAAPTERELAVREAFLASLNRESL